MHVLLQNRHIRVQVVCHWNEGTPALLRQMASAQRGRRAFGDAVVVLADRDKRAMDVELQQEARCHTLVL